MTLWYLGIDRFALVGESRVVGDYEYLRNIKQGGYDVFGSEKPDFYDSPALC